jgi:hypothetical protein
LVIALTVLVAPAPAAATVAVALLLTLPIRRKRLADLGSVALSAAVASGVQALLHLVVARSAEDDLAVLVEVALTGGAFLATDFVLRRRRGSQVWALYLTLLCAAALLAVAYERSPALSLVAVVPLLVTRYSFERFSRARQAYAQTTQALSLLPEVAGLTPLGHGERTAIYASALADELGFDPAAKARIATAARLHHIGYISLHEPEERTEPPDPGALGRVSGDLLRETGFLADLSELVEQAQEGSPPASGLDAAVIRVCSTLDDLAEAEAMRGEATAPDPFTEVLRCHPGGAERTAAIALLRMHDRRPDIVEEARAASRILSLVASGESTH